MLVRDFRHLSRHLHHGTAEGLVDSFLSDFNINQTLSRPSLSGWSRDSLRKSRGRFQNLIGSPQLSVLILGTFDLSVFRTRESQALSDINQRLVHTGTASTPPIPQRGAISLITLHCVHERSSARQSVTIHTARFSSSCEYPFAMFLPSQNEQEQNSEHLTP